MSMENNTKLEPFGAIGDAGWYNMKAAVTFSAIDRYPGERVITTAFFTMIKQQSQTIKSGD